MNWKLGIMVLAIGLVSGCYSPERPSLSSDCAPTAIPAIKEAADQDNRKAIPQLVQDLNDHDPAIRFAAISALNRITGDDFGYRYYDDESDRQPAIARWREWMKRHPSS